MTCDTFHDQKKIEMALILETFTPTVMSRVSLELNNRPSKYDIE